MLSQRALLERLGIAERMAVLCQQNPTRAAEIVAAFDRLTGTGAGQMGLLFKALCVSAPDLAVPAFLTPDPLIDRLSSERKAHA